MVRSCCCSLHETGADHKYRHGGWKGRVKKGLDLLASKYSPNFLSVSLSGLRRSLEAFVSGLLWVNVCLLVEKCCKKRERWQWKPPKLSFSLVFGASDVHIAVYLAALCARPFCSRKTSLPRQWCRGHRLFPPAWTRQGRVASWQKGPFRRVKKKRRGSEYLSKLPTVCCP